MSFNSGERPWKWPRARVVPFVAMATAALAVSRPSWGEQVLTGAGVTIRTEVPDDATKKPAPIYARGTVITVPNYLSRVRSGTLQVEIRGLKASEIQSELYDGVVITPGEHQGKPLLVRRYFPQVSSRPGFASEIAGAIAELQNARHFQRHLGLARASDGSLVLLDAAHGPELKAFSGEIALDQIRNAEEIAWRIRLVGEIAQQLFEAVGELGARELVLGDFRLENIGMGAPAGKLTDMLVQPTGLKIFDDALTTRFEEFESLFGTMRLETSVVPLAPEKVLGDYSHPAMFDPYLAARAVYWLMFGQSPAQQAGMKNELAVLRNPSLYARVLQSVRNRLDSTSARAEQLLGQNEGAAAALEILHRVNKVVFAFLQQYPGERERRAREGIPAEIGLNAAGAIEKVNITRETMIEKPLLAEDVKIVASESKKFEDFEPNWLALAWSPRIRSSQQDFNITKSKSSVQTTGMLFPAGQAELRLKLLPRISANLTFEYLLIRMSSAKVSTTIASSALGLTAHYALWVGPRDKLEAGAIVHSLAQPYFSVPAPTSTFINAVDGTTLNLGAELRASHQFSRGNFGSLSGIVGVPLSYSGQSGDAFESVSGSFEGLALDYHRPIGGEWFFRASAVFLYESFSYSQTAPYTASNARSTTDEVLRLGIGWSF